MDFSIIIPKGTELYRGINDKNKLDGNWFLYSAKDTLQYGNKIYKYKLNQDIKVINIMNGFFHIDYMDKVNLKYNGTDFDGIDNRKYLALIPIGLPDIEFQRKYLLEKTNIDENFANVLDPRTFQTGFNNSLKHFTGRVQ